MSDDIDLDAIQARAEAATAGPWKLWGMVVMADRDRTGNYDDCDDIAFTADDPDRGRRTFNAEFIAHAREDVPALIAEVRRLQSKLDDVVEVSKNVWLNSVERDTIIHEAGIMQNIAEQIDDATGVATHPVGLKWGE